MQLATGICIPTTESVIHLVDFLDVTSHEGVTWYQITPEDFLESIFPVWENIQLERPKRLLFFPCYFAFQISNDSVIYFSMFDKESKFLEADLSLIAIYSYLEDIPYPDESEGENEDEWEEGDLEVISCPILDLPLPPHLEPTPILPLEDIESVLYQNLLGEQFESVADIKGSHEDIELFLYLSPENILKWYKLMYLQMNRFQLQSCVLHLTVNDDVPYLSEIFERYGEYDLLLVCDLSEYPKTEVERVLNELMTLYMVEFEFNLANLSIEDLQECRQKLLAEKAKK